MVAGPFVRQYPLTHTTRSNRYADPYARTVDGHTRCNPETDGDRIATAFGNEENARLIAAAPELLDALHSLRDIARYYHKGDAPGHLDACENPDNCGHCLAMRKVDAAIDKATG